MRTSVYVDGFNLFYGALKGTPFKWLDPVRLSALVLPDECVIERPLYFTARVSGQSDPMAPARQQVYLNALATLPLVELHYGHFLAKTVWRPLANLPIADRRVNTPQPVILPQGHHRVLGRYPQTLSVGRYPERRGNRSGSRRRRGVPIPDAVIAEFHAMEEKGCPLRSDARDPPPAHDVADEAKTRDRPGHRMMAKLSSQLQRLLPAATEPVADPDVCCRNTCNHRAPPKAAVRSLRSSTPPIASCRGPKKAPVTNPSSPPV